VVIFNDGVYQLLSERLVRAPSFERCRAVEGNLGGCNLDGVSTE